jgi:hypothetical protein
LEAKMALIKQHQAQNNWEDSLHELNSYIADNSDIILAKDRIVIPQEKKGRFYHLFDEIRDSIVLKEIKGLLYRAYELSINYIATEEILCRKETAVTALTRKKINVIKKDRLSLIKRASNALGLSGFRFNEVLLEDELRLFLNNPSKAMARVVYDPLFELLQNKITQNEFQEIVVEKLPLEFYRLFYAGYQTWVILSLLTKLKTQSAYKPVSHVLSPRQIKSYSRLDAEPVSEYPMVTKNNNLIFKHERKILDLCSADAVIKCAKTNHYLGVKRGALYAAACKIKTSSNNRHKIGLKQLGISGENAPIFLFCGNTARDVSLVGDKEHIMQPDIVIHCRENVGLSPEGDNEHIKLLHRLISPALGTFVVIGPDTEKVAYYGDGITTLEVGYDGTKLKTIIDKLIGT